VLEDNDDSDGDSDGGANEDSDGDEMIGASTTGALAVDPPTGARAATGGTAEGGTDNRDEGVTDTSIPADVTAQLILALETSSEGVVDVADGTRVSGVMVRVASTPAPSSCTSGLPTTPCSPCGGTQPLPREICT
jgi:hypothetical protein